MIVFQHYHIVQAHAVIMATPQYHGPFFEPTEVRGCFAGIEQTARGVFNFIYVLRR